MNPTATLPRVDQQAFYLAASGDYERCIAELERRRIEAGEAKALLNLAREALKDIEADMLVNGGHGKYVIDGNETKRVAILRAALAAFPAYVTQRQRVTDLERELSKVEAGRDLTANTLSLAKSRMDAYVAATQRAASILMYGNHASNAH